MSEQLNGFVLCGALEENEDFSPIYCNLETGECIFSDPALGDYRLISEVSVAHPTEVEYTAVIEDLQCGEFGECIGIIYNDKQLVKLLSDEEATIIPASAPTAIGRRIQIDIYGDYGEDVEECL